MDFLHFFQDLSTASKYATEWVQLMPQIQKLVEMGFAEAQVRSTLEATGWDENMALEKLLSS